MSVLARLFNFVAGTAAVADDVDSEFNQIVNMLAGTSTSKNVILKFSDATTAPITTDQTSTGPLGTWRLAGTDVVTMNNLGNVVTTTAAPIDAGDLTRKDYVDGRKITFMYHGHVAGALTAAANLFPQFIVPSGLTSPAAISASFVHKTTTTNGSTTIDVIRRRAAADTVIGTITIPTATTVQTVVTQDFADDSLTAGDIVFFSVTAVAGTPPSDSTVQLNLEQKVRA